MKKKIITLLSTLQGKVIISLEDTVKVKTLVRISSDKKKFDNINDKMCKAKAIDSGNKEDISYCEYLLI